MTDTKTPATVTAAVSAAALIQAVADLAPFASKDDTLPSITCLHLAVRDGKLRLEATDRYVAGWDELELLAEPAGELDIMVRAAELTRIAKTADGILKPASRMNLADPPQIVISHVEGMQYATFTVTAYPGPDTPLPVEVPDVAATYPKIERLVPSEDGSLVVRFNADKLATLCKVTKTAYQGSRKRQDVIVRLHLHEGTGPVLARLEGDDTFGALVMTVRDPGGTGTAFRPAGRWPEAGDTIRFEKAAAYLGEYLVTDIDRDTIGFSTPGADGPDYRMPVALARELRVTVTKSWSEARPVPPAPERAETADDTRPASAKYRALLGYPDPSEGVKEPTVSQLEAMLERAVHDSGSPSFETSCSQGCEVEPDGKCGHGHPSWLRRYALI